MNNERKPIKSIRFDESYYPEILAVANELSQLEDRKAADSLRILLIEEGRKKIDRLKLEKGIQ